MSWRYLDRIDGIAIDNENTSAHHQLISVDKKENTLQYTVFYEPLNNQNYKVKVTPNMQGAFVKEMNVKTPVNRNKMGRLTEAYDEFFESIRPHGRSVGFQTKELAKALTFNISFNQNYQMTDMSYSPTLGYMTHKMTCRDAEDRMNKWEDLQIMHEIAFNSLTTKKRPEKEDFRFESVIQRIGDFVREKKLHQDLKANMDCIFRNDEMVKISQREQEKIDKMTIHEWADTFARYHAVREFLRNSTDKTAPKKSVVPTTASRSEIDHFNIMVTAETLVNGGKSPFYSDVAMGVANYKKHEMAWKQFGLI